MLDINKSTLIETHLNKVSSSVSKIEEGSALIYIMENGLSVVSPAAGAGGETYAGVTHSRITRPNTAVGTVEFTVPGSSPYTVTLSETPITTPGVYINNVKAAVGGAAGQYAIAGAVLTFNSADAGKNVRVVYDYNLTQVKAALLFGNDLVEPDLSTGQSIAVITTGMVFIDNFVVEDDWESVNPSIYLAAGGKFTTQSGGTQVDAIVISTPSASAGMLGLRFHP